MKKILIILAAFSLSTGVASAQTAPTKVKYKAKTDQAAKAQKTPEQKAETRRSWNQWDVINSGVVLTLILMAYIYFSG